MGVTCFDDASFGKPFSSLVPDKTRTCALESQQSPVLQKVWVQFHLWTKHLKTALPGGFLLQWNEFLSAFTFLLETQDSRFLLLQNGNIQKCQKIFLKLKLHPHLTHPCELTLEMSCSGDSDWFGLWWFFFFCYLKSVKKYKVAKRKQILCLFVFKADCLFHIESVVTDFSLWGERTKNSILLP